MKKYSYNEIKKGLEFEQAVSEEALPISLEIILEAMKDLMIDQHIGPDDRVWEWPLKDQEDITNYDRAMSIL